MKAAMPAKDATIAPRMAGEDQPRSGRSISAQ
jgi:hypothetical protein